MNERQRPAVPREIKREVRRRCGFGCVICGVPLIEYDHMFEWAVVRRHVASEITLLCPQHHAEKSRGLLPKQDVIKANENPFNLQKGVSTNHFLHYSGKHVEIALANNVFKYRNLLENNFISALEVDGMAVLGFRVEDEKLLMQFMAFDEFNIPVLQIVDNELRYATNQWDVEYVGQKLTIREGHGRTLIQLVFEIPNTIRITKGRILRNGIELLIGKDYVFCSNARVFISGHKTINSPVGMAFGFSVVDTQAAVVFSKIPRYGIDRVAARQFLRKSLSKVRQKNLSI